MNTRAPCAGGTVSAGVSRRRFLGCAAAAFSAGLLFPHRGTAFSAGGTAPSGVALTQGESRAGNVYEALKRIEPRVRAALAGKKRVLIKPNMVLVDRQLCASHAECMEGILEFLAPLMADEIVIAETPANGPAAAGYDHYGYHRLAKSYRVRLLDLDAEPWETQYLVDERHHAQPARCSARLLDRDTFLISTAPMKTHDRAVVTLGLKNLAVGSLLKDAGFTWGPDSQGKSDKHLVHGGPQNQGIHYNMFSLAQRIWPGLTVLDGFEGMEHNGPISGTPVAHRVAVASTDALAADRVGASLMGFDWQKIGYLVFCAQARLGETDVDRLELLGPSIYELARPYVPHDSIEQQYQWM